MFIDMHIGICMVMHMDMRMDMCMGMPMDMHMDAHTNMRLDMCADVWYWRAGWLARSCMGGRIARTFLGRT